MKAESLVRRVSKKYAADASDSIIEEHVVERGRRRGRQGFDGLLSDKSSDDG